MKTDDVIVEGSDRPKVKELIADYKRCSPWDGSWNRLSGNEEIRYSVWPGQTPDGKKHDENYLAATNKKAFPFDGASDTLILMADGIIGEFADLLYVSFTRAASAQKLSLDVEKGYALKLLDYLLWEVMAGELDEQVELAAQYRGTYGYFFLHTRWAREVSLERQTVKLDQLLLALDAMAGNGLPKSGDFQAMLMDEKQIEPVTEVLAALYDYHAKQQGKAYGLELDLPKLRKATLRQAAKDLRESGEADVPMPYVCRNEPEILTLKPYDEVLISGSVTNLKKARVYQRMYLDEVSLRRKIVEEGWSEAWVEEVLKHKGKMSQWAGMRTGNGAQVPTWDPTRFNDATFTMYDSKNDLCEICYATYWALDSDHVPGVYCTVFHPEVCGEDGRELYAAHGLLEEGRIPYVLSRREVTGPQLTSSRGIPEIVRGWQREKKVQRDAGIDLLSVAIMPPINEYANALGANYKYGPGAKNKVQPGREPKFMEVPKGGAPLSFEMSDRVDRDVDQYFARMSEHVPPVLSQARLQKETNSFLWAWTKAFMMVLDLCQYNMPDAEFSRVTGAPEGWLDQRREKKGLFRSALHFDVRELDPEYVKGQLEMLNNMIVPGDTTGSVNRRLLTKMQLQAINPRLARELIMDEGAVSQQLYDGVNNDLALMFLGNVPKMVENDPTAGAKLQFAQQIIQGNPNYQQALQQPESRFAKLVEAWAKNLSFSMQQEENKQIGRIGVDPKQLEG